MLASVTLNWWAILITGVINVILGGIWYSPMVFGKTWMELTGIKEMKPNPKTMFGMFVVALLIAAVLTHFVVYASAGTFMLGLEVGVLAAIGFVVLPGASSTLASGTSWKLWAINTGYWLVALAIMGGFLAVMR